MLKGGLLGLGHISKQYEIPVLVSWRYRFWGKKGRSRLRITFIR